MSDSYVIVIRIVPIVPCNGSDFTKYLTGLELTAYDRTVYDTSPDIVTGQNDVLLGTASGVAGLGADSFGNPLPPVLTVTPGSNPAAYTNSIVQHYEIITTTSPFSPPVTSYTAKSAATALIVVNFSSNHPEYPQYSDSAAFDVRMEVTRSGNPVSMPPLIIEYNITNVITLTPGIDISSLLNTYAWAVTLPCSLYVWIPPPPPTSNIAFLSQGTASTPPNFYTLKTAINAVLADDFPATAPSLDQMTVPLTMAQCSEIASEIIYDRTTDPPPDPPLPSTPPLGPPILPDGIELFYSLPDNTNQSAGQGSPTWVRISFCLSLFSDYSEVVRFHF
jgi:hypothetical protein